MPFREKSSLINRRDSRSLQGAGGRKLHIIYMACVELDVPDACSVHVIEVCNAFARLGHKVHLIAPRGAPQTSISPSVQRSQLPFFGFTPARLFPFHLILAARLAAAILKARPDLVYERLSLSILPALVCRLLGVPLVIEVNGDIQREKLGKSGLRLALDLLTEKISLRLCHLAVFPLHYMEEVVRRRHRLSPEKTATVRHGVDLSRFRPMPKEQARKRFGLPVASLIIGFVGSFKPWHHLEKLVASFPFVCRLLPETMAVLAGDGPEKARLEKEVAKMGLGDRVLFLGPFPHEEIPQLISTFDIAYFYCDQSVPEPFLAMKTFEYLACNVPVTGNFRLNLEGSGKITFLPRASEPEELATELVRVLKEVRENPFSDQPRQFAERNGSWERVVKDIIGHVVRTGEETSCRDHLPAS